MYQDCWFDDMPLFDRDLDAVMELLESELSSDELIRLSEIELTPANLRRFCATLGNSDLCQKLEALL